MSRRLDVLKLEGKNMSTSVKVVASGGLLALSLLKKLIGLVRSSGSNRTGETVVTDTYAASLAGLVNFYQKRGHDLSGALARALRHQAPLKLTAPQNGRKKWGKRIGLLLGAGAGIYGLARRFFRKKFRRRQSGHGNTTNPPAG